MADKKSKDEIEEIKEIESEEVEETPEEVSEEAEETEDAEEIVNEVEDAVEEELESEAEIKICNLIAPIFLSIDSDNTKEHVGDMTFIASTKELQITPIVANVAAQLENALLGDVSIRDEKTGAITMVSREEEPEEWIRNLVNSLEFSGNPFIADPVIEICENEA